MTSLRHRLGLGLRQGLGRGVLLLNEGGGGPWGGRSGGSGGSGGGSGGNSGGGGSGGPPNPWRQPPEGERPRGGKGPSALDELLRRGRGVRGRMPGGEAGPRLVGYALLGLIALWIALTSIHQIQPAERGVVTRLGRYSHTLNPGISLTLPAPFDRVQTIDVQNIRTISIPEGNGERLVMTGDQNIIDVEFQVRWSIRDPEQWLFQSVSPDQTIQSVAESAMRAAIANVTLTQAIGSGRAGIEQEVAARMQALLDRYHAGVTIQGVAIKAAPPASVKAAFDKVSAAQQKAQTSINQANAYASQVVAHAQGGAAAFDAVYTQYKLSPEVTRRRMYYETMEQVLSKVDKTVVETPGVLPYLPLPGGKKAAADPAPAEPHP